MTREVRTTRLGQFINGSLEVSCGVVDELLDGRVIKRGVVDCGSMERFEDGVETVIYPDFSFFNDGVKIDYVLLTHGHFDHVGSLRKLLPFLAPKARIFATTDTVAGLKQGYEFELMLTASAIEERQKQATKPGYVAKKPMLELTPEEVAATKETLARFSAIQRPGEHTLCGYLMEAEPAGHMHGACSWTIHIRNREIHFAGDTCDHDLPCLPGRRPISPGRRRDIVGGCDCTYGATVSVPSWESEDARMIETFRAALKANRPVVCFSFAHERSASIAHRIVESGLAAEFPGRFVMDGSARELTKLFLDRTNLWSDLEQPFNIKGIRLIKKSSERATLARGDQSLVVITTPGMGGPCGKAGIFWRGLCLANPDALMCFSGYVAEGTDGRRILDAAAQREHDGKVPVLIFHEKDPEGETVPVARRLRCQLDQFRIGGHNRNSFAWFDENQPKVVILSHGDKAALDAVQKYLDGKDVVVYRADETPSVTLPLE